MMIICLQMLDPFTGGDDGNNALIKPQIKGGIAFIVILIAFLAFAQATRCVPDLGHLAMPAGHTLRCSST